MQRQVALHAALVDELVDLAVAVAGDVGEDALAGGFLVEAVDGHDREQLADGPGVGQALEHAEIAVVEIAQHPVQVDELGARVLDLPGEPADLADRRPEQLFGQRPFAQAGLAVLEQAPGLVAIEDGVVEHLLDVAHGQGLEGLDHVFELGRATLGQPLGQRVGLEAGDVEDVEQQDRVVGHQGPARFGDDDRVGDVVLVERGHHRLDDVRAVFLEGVVAAGQEVGLGAVVVHCQAAAEVEVFDLRALPDQAGVDAAGLVHRGADLADVGDLRAQVVVDQLEAVEHAGAGEQVHRLDNLVGVEPEDGALAAGLGPVAAGLGRQLDADAENGLGVQGLGALEDERQLVGHLHHEDAGEADLGGVEAEVDELLVLVAVADEHRLLVAHHAHGGDQLRLGAGLETVVVARAELGDLLHHLLLLVDLDRVGAHEAAGVAQLFHGGAEGLVEAGDLGVEDVLDAQEHRHVQAAFAHAVGHGGDAHRPVHGARLGHDHHVAVLGDEEKAAAPFGDTVQVGRFADVPAFHGVVHPLPPCKVKGSL